MVQESLFREWCGLALDKDRHIFRIGTVWLMTNASLISHLWIACLAHDLGSPRDVYFISNKLTLFFIARSEYFSSLWAMHFPTEKQFLFYLSSKKVWYDIHPCTSINSSQESKAVGFSSVCNQLLMWPLPRRFIAHIVLCWILKVTAHQYIMRDFFLCVWLYSGHECRLQGKLGSWRKWKFLLLLLFKHWILPASILLEGGLQ